MRLTELKNVSDKREAAFKKLNITCVEDLIKHFPRDYLDLTKTVDLEGVMHNSFALVYCEVLTVEFNRYSRRQYVRAMCRQNDSIFCAIWFNQPYIAQKLKVGSYFLYGRVRNKDNMTVTMVNPSFEPAGANRNLRGIIPVYPLSGILTQKVVRDCIRQALTLVPVTSLIPAPLCKKYALTELKSAYNAVHNPKSMEQAAEGAARIACEEYFTLISAFKVIKGDSKTARTNVYTVTERQTADFMARFPFEFTAGQKGAVREIYNDLHSPVKMNRLLQGDVGSGKTAVALTGIYMAVKSGFQAAMIAPTEVLAQQNYALIAKYFPDYEVRLLTGSATAAQKRQIKAELAMGAAQIVCGTHAVIQKDVFFNNLAFAVCDEQHRFGVAQRSSLSDKGAGCDVLIMSATPIPRTLSLIFYGDLDISTIKDKPAARQEISTSVIPAHKYSAMLKYIAAEAKAGRQAYFVCPKIEGDDEGTVMSVTELYEELCAQLKGVNLALLHGKMKDAQKNQIMADFKAKKYDCLVSTTVIEVGVDVPDATIMVIYNAEMFGLSQLHQLRGRVGRGTQKSYCFLLMGKDTPEARERLQVVKNNTDGFKIAEFDLQMRGSGDFMGTRQSGRVLSEIKNLRFPASVIFTAKAIADEAFSGGFDVKYLTTAALKKYESLKDIVLN